MFYCRAARHFATFVHYHFIRIYCGMRSAEKVFAALSLNFLNFAGFGIKVVISPFAVHCTFGFHQRAALFQPHIAGFHVAFGTHGFQSFVALRNYDIALGNKIAAYGIITCIIAGHGYRQRLRLRGINFFAASCFTVGFNVFGFRLRHLPVKIRLGITPVAAGIVFCPGSV